jgi:hypothetical protein
MITIYKKVKYMAYNYNNPHSLQFLHFYMDWAIIVSR